jgi:hypothetical protein
VPADKYCRANTKTFAAIKTLTAENFI